MNLYDLTVAAEQQVSTYCSANIDEWRDAIDPVLEAAGECTIGKDHVDDITVSEDEISIRTSYSVRCCEQSNDMSVPLSIVKAENPIQAANRYRVGNELEDARSRLAAAQRFVVEYSEKVASLTVELSTFDVSLANFNPAI